MPRDPWQVQDYWKGRHLINTKKNTPSENSKLYFHKTYHLGAISLTQYYERDISELTEDEQLSDYAHLKAKEFVEKNV